MKAWLILHKKAVILAAAALVVLGTAVGLLVGRGYRTIQIYELVGEAALTREGEQLTPYVNMQLKSGDRAETFADSFLYLRMDNDKYMLAEPETVFSLEASGSPRSSRTQIHLEAGAVVNHITRPLSAASSYVVTTPNSTMAVRGTSFRVYVWYDAAGLSHTLLQVFEGVVEVHLLYPDGRIGEEGRLFRAGETASIWGSSEDADYDEETAGIDYYKLEIRTLEFLKIGIGQPVTGYDVTDSEVDEIIKLKQTVFQVRFVVGGQVFGTQSVLFDHTASPPLLTPAAGGAWDFDFDTPIRADTDIPWA